MNLRPATAEDAPSLARLGRESFVAKFGHLYSDQDLSSFLQQVYDPPVVASEIADEAQIHCLAEEGGQLVGFCKMICPSCYAGHSDARHPIALGQLYTDPARTGQGIGARLMDWALEEARTRACDAIQLSVYSENAAAQRFYERHGFTKIADIHFMVGNHRDDEFLYELRLEADRS